MHRNIRLVGVSFWASSRGNPLLSYLIVSNGIGLSVTVLTRLLSRVLGGRLSVLRVLIVAPLSVVIGVELGAWTFGGIPSLIERTSVHTWLGYASSFFVVCAISVAVTLVI
ncbi:hypothetical protein BPMI_02210c [Candidatus Burkholderia pumila]|uniref:Uncharacterized protein n=1 Tax=Candidatus Burkholderia pumila TaxID=1090375 RepID=A0ABR5HKW2_9BURK|nr:hypothetical protein BPMI_02210c [Candidatus Burkholderia pumila]